uniref:Glucagon n=1 Tax=Amphilophus citrinellus TaxID=61819 RepID=A0A3Q0ST55_AMPCI
MKSIHSLAGILLVLGFVQSSWQVPVHDDSLRSEMERRGETFNKRHVDGSFTSDVNKVLDSIAAKEYLLWVMTSKPSGESNCVMPSCQYGPNVLWNVFQHLVEAVLQRIKVILKVKGGPTQP